MVTPIAPAGPPCIRTSIHHATGTNTVHALTRRVHMHQAVSIGEALRAAGDTAWCMWTRLVSAWTVFVPVAWWIEVRMHGGPAGAIGVTIFYLAVLAAAFLWRFH